MSTKIDGNKIVAHINGKWRGAVCPMCKGGPWSVQDTLFELREFNEGNMIIGGVPIIPLIPVACSNCGHTVLINAIVAGLVSPSAGVGK